MMADHKKASIWAILTRTTAIIIRGNAPLFLGNLGIGVVHSLSWAIGTWVMQLFFDSVQAAIGGAPTAIAYGMIVLVGLMALAQQALNGFSNFLGGMCFEKIGGVLRHHLHKKALRVDPVAYESPSMLDDVEKARAGADSAFNIVANVVMTISFYGVYFGFVGVYLFSLAPSLALALPIIFVPSMVTVICRAKIYTKLENLAAPARRRMEAHENAIGDRAFYKETRTLGAYAYFKRQYEETMRLFNRDNWKADRTSGLIELALKALSLCGMVAVLFLLLHSLISRAITLGAFAAVLGSLGMFVGIMDEMVARNMSQVAGDVGKAVNFIAFLDLPERSGTLHPQGEASVALRGATFRYPGANRDALCGIDLSIGAGETVAIVGENGAGKSTLVRLITGLYLPSEGSVLIRGAHTRDCAPNALYSGLSAVMQAFERYKMTLRQNVALGDAGSDEPIGPSLTKADLQADGFPQGEDTMLSREFDGIDLSGGQWQRVALARGFFRRHDLIVLDEPTAAIDPLEETRLYQKFAELSAGKTAVIVTHRLGSARIADRIVVMDGGRIDAIGTHDQLLAAGGKYAQMFNAQAQWYRAGNGATPYSSIN